ncbi:hypothetical protein [Metallibacterium scheffleri]
MNARTAVRLDGQTRACPWLHEIEQRAKVREYSVRIFAQADSAARWRSARNWRRLAGPGTCTLLPPDERPAALRWPAGTVIANVTRAAGDEIHELALALIRDGCELAFMTDLQSGITHRVVPAKDGAPWQS